MAVGQFTPGPVFTTATFVGYPVGSWPGASVAAILLIRFRVNSAWLVLGGGAVGLAASVIRPA